jgi:hypothetical protein
MAIRSAKGTLLKFQDEAGSPATFSTLGQLRSFTQSGPTATIPDVTTHATSGNFMEKLAVLLDPGTVAGPINYDPADATHQFAAGVWLKLINLTKQTWQIIFPASMGQMGGDGYFSSHSVDMPTDNVLQANIEMALTAAITATN